MTRSRVYSLLSFAVGVAVLGCAGGNPAAPARVSGTISYNGQPIKAGNMAFVAADGIAHGAIIAPDGTYSANDIPVGEMIVTVETESLKPKQTSKSKDADRRMKMSMQPAPPGVEKPADHYTKIPAKYGSSKTSPLTVTLSAGRQVHNFDLTD